MTRKAAPLEKDIQAKILEYLTKCGVFHFKAIVSSKLGIPDIITCINGRFVCFEVKRSETARIHPMQHHIHEQITEAGGEVYIVWSVAQVKQVVEFSIKSVE